MELVLDASLALALGLPDEQARKADRNMAQYLGEKTVFWVPALWWFEISNALIMAQRRNRLSETDTLCLIDLYAKLPLSTDILINANLIAQLQRLAKTYELSAYDAAYLELAQRKNLGLATLDRSLIAAAKKAGIALAT